MTMASVDGAVSTFDIALSTICLLDMKVILDRSDR